MKWITYHLKLQLPSAIGIFTESSTSLFIRLAHNFTVLLHSHSTLIFRCSMRLFSVRKLCTAPDSRQTQLRTSWWTSQAVRTEISLHSMALYVNDLICQARKMLDSSFTIMQLYNSIRHHQGSSSHLFNWWLKAKCCPLITSFWPFYVSILISPVYC